MAIEERFVRAKNARRGAVLESAERPAQLEMKLVAEVRNCFQRITVPADRGRNGAKRKELWYREHCTTISGTACTQLPPNCL